MKLNMGQLSLDIMMLLHPLKPQHTTSAMATHMKAPLASAVVQASPALPGQLVFKRAGIAREGVVLLVVREEPAADFKVTHVDLLAVRRHYSTSSLDCQPKNRAAGLPYFITTTFYCAPKLVVACSSHWCCWQEMLDCCWQYSGP